MRMRSINWVGASLAVGTALVMVGQPNEAKASSHREAPFITKSPKVDNTDFYMFRSYETGKDDTVTVIANYQPLQDAYGGPNYFSMDPEALYEMHFDTDGDGDEDLTFQFRFQQVLNGANGVTLAVGPTGNTKDVAIPFINANVAGGDARPLITFANQNSFRHVFETYTVNVVRGNRRTGTVAPVTKADNTPFVKPLDYIGTKSLGNAAAYKAYADQHITTAAIPAGAGACAAGANIRVFAGQRKEGFAVLLGNIFDLVNATATQLTLPTGGAIGAANNPIGNKNVSSIAIEVPTSCLKGAQPIVGGWATASVRQARAINPGATYTTPSKEGGAWAQVSRLGSPLVNEVIIGLKDKDKFNASEPKDDVQFADYITNPTLPKVLQVLFGAATVAEPTVFPRADLVAAFATGIPGVNQVRADVVAEMLRLNTDLPVTAPTPNKQNYLGALQCFVPGADNNSPKTAALPPGNPKCDLAGFPNGRRPGDDVVDIALRASVGVLLGGTGGTNAPTADLPLGDAVRQDATDFETSFPYLRAPNAGAQPIP